jgi:hypothetical protein
MILQSKQPTLLVAAQVYTVVQLGLGHHSINKPQHLQTKLFACLIKLWMGIQPYLSLSIFWICLHYVMSLEQGSKIK